MGRKYQIECEDGGVVTVDLQGSGYIDYESVPGSVCFCGVGAELLAEFPLSRVKRILLLGGDQVSLSGQDIYHGESFVLEADA